jgi:hydrogenase maturation protease
MTRPAGRSVGSGLLIIGIGNEYRGDDAAGIAVARKLKQKQIPRCSVTEGTGDGADLINDWCEADTVILVDATCSGLTPGAITRIDLHKEEVKFGLLHLSSHALGIAEAIALSRTMGTFPSRAIFFGIEGKSFEHGCMLSQEVTAGIDVVVSRIEEEIHSNSEIPERSTYGG